MEAEARVITHRDPAHQCGHWRQVILQRWTGAVSPLSLEIGRRLGQELADRYGTQVGVLTVIEEGVLLPGQRVRAQAAADMAAAAARTGAVATVIPGTGVAASAYPAVLTTINQLARASHPTQVCSSEVQAADFLAQRLDLGAGQPAAALARAAASLR